MSAANNNNSKHKQQRPRGTDACHCSVVKQVCGLVVLLLLPLLWL
jgi:hypothetical protein